jgi:hypothetical protein
MSQRPTTQQLQPFLSAPCGNSQFGKLQGDLDNEKDLLRTATPLKLTYIQCGQGPYGRVNAELFYISIGRLRLRDFD